MSAITPETLAAWTGTDAALARHLGVTRQAIQYARAVHGIPSTVDGRRGPRPHLSRTVIRAIVREAQRRGITVVDVLREARAEIEGVEP